MTNQKVILKILSWSMSFTSSSRLSITGCEDPRTPCYWQIALRAFSMKKLLKLLAPFTGSSQDLSFPQYKVAKLFVVLWLDYCYNWLDKLHKTSLNRLSHVCNTLGHHSTMVLAGCAPCTEIPNYLNGGSCIHSLDPIIQPV